ncbi:MAG: site-specific DNA-methyltransferase [Janthinobacterium lividum]
MATGISKTFWTKEAALAETFVPDDFHPVWTNVSDHRNKLFYGENLSVLRDLVADDNIRNKVNLIYIDPPYSTNTVFQNRQQEDAYTDLLKGDDYVSFIGARLELMRELLSENGSIFVHLDANMVFHVKVLMDNIFGKDNFRGMITRQKCRPKNYTKKTFGNISDYILYYSKSAHPIWNRPLAAWTDEKMLKEYQCVEEDGRRYKKVPIHAPGTRNGSTGTEWRGMMPPPGKHWQYTPEKLDEFEARGEIYWSANGNPRRKVYWNADGGIPIQDIWLDCVDASNQNTVITGYPTEKNPLILQRIIEAASNADDLVLDCFAGSGTTLAVASELGRRWIGVDCSDIAIKTTLNRFKNGSDKMGDYVKKPSKQKAELFDTSTATAVESKKKEHKMINNFSFYVPTELENPFSEVLTELAR